MKQQTYESLVSWCSFNTWNPRLTDDVPGFIAGVEEQTVFQNLIIFSVRRKNFELWIHLPLFSSYIYPLCLYCFWFVCEM